MANEESFKRLISRIQMLTENVKPDSPEMRKAFTKIGLLLSSQIKLNLRSAKLIDKGRLINSIRYEFFRDGAATGIKVGSFGVEYAAAHEFGAKMSVNVRNHNRRINKAFGRSIEPRDVNVRQHNRTMNIRERAYMRRAIAKHRNAVVRLIREGFGL